MYGKLIYHHYLNAEMFAKFPGEKVSVNVQGQFPQMFGPGTRKSVKTACLQKISLPGN